MTTATSNSNIVSPGEINQMNAPHWYRIRDDSPTEQPSLYCVSWQTSIKRVVLFCSPPTSFVLPKVLDTVGPVDLNYIRICVPSEGATLIEVHSNEQHRQRIQEMGDLFSTHKVSFFSTEAFPVDLQEFYAFATSLLPPTITSFVFELVPFGDPSSKHIRLSLHEKHIEVLLSLVSIDW
jgi:hypothetical protein